MARKSRPKAENKVAKATDAGTSRRRFLAGSAALAAGGLVAGRAAADEPAGPAVPEWTRALGDPVDAAPYGQPSSHEAHVIRRNIDWLTPTAEASVNFTPIHELDGIITPNGLCFERHHAGTARVDPARHQLLVHGLVEQELFFTVEELMRFPPESQICFLECAANGGMEWRGAQMNGCQFTHGMIHCVEYTGVRLSTLLARAGLKDKAAWLLVEGADAAAMTRSLPLAKAMDDVLVAYSMNGERLRPEQGYPLRLVVPGWEGNIWIKWLRRIEVGDQPWQTREETAKYSDLMADGRAQQFSMVMGVKSVITDPSPQKPVNGKGTLPIKGLAWSGDGKIARVDVSLDGGRNWRPARLSGPVLPHCLTRFYLDWQWDGSAALLQSRAIDETGAVQPTLEEVVAARGLNSTYHNNSIQTWLLEAGGNVENVHVS
jgi:sulfane dehydrogenase subunit SoxC